MASPDPKVPPLHRRGLEAFFESGLLRARWLMAPFYLGLVVALTALVAVFVNELIHQLAGVVSMTPEKAILMALSLIDLSLVGNLLLIVIFSGYENFVSKIDVGSADERPVWMGSVDFAGLKIKLMGSIVAISAIALLRSFMELAEGNTIDERRLAWLLALHLMFIVSGVLLAAMDWAASRTSRR